MTAPATRSLGGLALTLTRRWWPQLAALAAACAVVATTISGALGVGDLIQGGLRSLALERLGRIDAAVLGDGFFRRDLALELARSVRDQPRPPQFTPAIVMPATVASAVRASAVSRATLLACDDPAALGFEPAPPPLAEGTVLVNAQLAAAIGVAEADTLVLRLPRRSRVPADSPLGRRTGDSLSRRLRVLAVLPDAGIGRFSVRPAQATQPLVVLSLEDAQAILREGDVANAIFVVAAAVPADSDASDDTLGVAALIRTMLQPRLDDYGLAIDPAEGDGLRLSSRRLMIPKEVDRAAGEVLGSRGGWPSLAFLANDMLPQGSSAAAAPRIPYSTVLGIEGASLPGGGLVDAAGAVLPSPVGDEIIVGRWMADDLAAQGRPLAIGDSLAVRFFLPETIHGQVEERTESFRVSGFAEMRGTAVDRSLVPEVEGVTDEESIADWNPPFPFDSSRVRTVPPHDQDDQYWKQYRATPKAFVSLAAARRIAGSRFGITTAWHVARPDMPREELAARLAAAINPEAAGIAVVPLRAEAVAAARGSTPFGGLFLALSAFVVVAGLLLAWLLFGLLVAAQRRAIGLLAAVGWPPARLSRLLLVIGGLAALAGVLAGAVLGPIWSRLLIAVLERAWNGDVAAGSSAVFRGSLLGPFAPLAGCVATLVMAIAALAVAAQRAGLTPPLTLLSGSAVASDGFRRPGRWSTTIAALSLLAAGVAPVAARNATAATAVGLFFAAGCAALGGLLTLARGRLFAGNATSAVRSLPQFAARTVAARPGRGFSIAAIVAAGQFLVVAVSAFALRPPADVADRRSPTGGWTWIAALGEPSSIDPADRDALAVLGLTAAQERALGSCEIARLRASDGDDASCTNLYAASRPTVLGVGPGFVARGGFSFTAHAPLAAGAAGNPWRLLDGIADRDDGPVPAVLDQATAQWGLKLGGVGSRFTLPDEAGETTEFEIVGLLEPGILQGRVIVAERNFQRLFPSRSGYSLALVDAAAVDVASRPQVPAALQAAWADAGVSLELAVDRLRALQAVQNTFLTGFQVLGTLGLLLGTAGVAAVQLQGVVERLGALAILHAVGFSLIRIRTWLMLETLVTVGAGLVIGTLAGAIAVWPALAGGVGRLPLLWIAATGGVTLVAAAAAGWFATGVVKTGFARPADRTLLSRACTSP